MDQITLSQTIIKKLKDDYNCPQRIKATYMDRTAKDEPSDAMIKGMYFEYKAIGNPNFDGEVIDDLARIQGGKKSTEHLRIDQQVERFKKEVMPLYDIQIQGHGEDFIAELNGHVKLKIKIDFYGTIVLEDGVYPLIGDLKLTANLHSQWGDFSWGNPFNMDHTQAMVYTYVFKKVMLESGEKFTKDPIFIYFVFDYKPIPEYKLIHVNPSPIRMSEMEESIRSVWEKIRVYERTGWPYNPSFVQCSKCPLNKTCPAVIKKQPIQII